MKTTQELLNLLNLQRVDERTFDGTSFSVGSSNVFGGQVLAQAVYAAYQTVPDDRFCHSLHAYFILPGNLQKPIRYKVRLIRDGRSFTTRYVTAEQDDIPIFLLSASFQLEETGLGYQQPMPDVPHPDKVMSLEDIYNEFRDHLPEQVKRYLIRERPVTFKPTVLPGLSEAAETPPLQNVWFRCNDVPAGLSLRDFHSILSYVSDYNLLSTALHPHAPRAHPGNTMMASIDHSIWIHRRPEDFAAWFLFNVEVQSNSNGRGFVTGKIFDQEGTLIATVAQEGLIRVKS